MKREFLESLGLDKETVDKIMAENGSDLEREKAETEQYKAQLADRDYSDAIAAAITGKGLRFSSKSAQRAFTAALKEQKLELKDGQLTGLDEFIQAQKQADPEAFAPDKAPPRFATGSGHGGGHGEPPKAPSRAAQLAAAHHASLYGETKKE